MPLADTSSSLPDLCKMLFSAGSLAITAYFWFVRVNREKINLGVFPAGGFEGTLESGGVGLWTGRLYLANRSILPTAVVAVTAELWWDGRWQSGFVAAGEGSELPWNLPPNQVFARSFRSAFELPADTDRERVYAAQRLRFTFATVEGSRVVVEFGSEALAVAA